MSENINEFYKAMANIPNNMEDAFKTRPASLQEPLKIKTFSNELEKLNKAITEMCLLKYGKNTIPMHEVQQLIIQVRDKLNTYEETPTIKHTSTEHY